MRARRQPRQYCRICVLTKNRLLSSQSRWSWRKFTKKEYKVFVAFEEGKSIDEIKLIVKEDEEKIQEHFKVACKKLNQEKIKKELVSYE